MTRLAASESYPASAALWSAQYVFPLAVANLRFNQGRLAEALSCAKRSKHKEFTDRLTFMLGELSSPAVANTYPPTPEGEFDGRVLQVLHSATPTDPNGYAVRTEHILTSLAGLGISQSAITRLGYPWDLNRHAERERIPSLSQSSRWEYRHRALESQGSPISLAGREDRYIDAYADWIEDAAQKHKTNIIHAHSNYLNGLAAVKAAKRLKLPAIYEMRGLWHLTRATREPDYLDSEHYRFCERRELQAAMGVHRVVAISNELASWLVDRGVDSRKITVIPNAAAEVVKQPAEKSNPPTVGYIGSFVDYEGLDLLLDAVAALVKVKPTLKAILVGDGPCYPQLREQITRLGLTDTVELPGRINPEAVADYYQRFDVAVVPRRSNAVTELVPPLKPMEIMAHGVPCVATNLAPLASMFATREQAILTPENNARALAEDIACVLDDQELADRLRTNGLDWAAKNSWTANAQSYSLLYKQAYQKSTAQQKDP